MNALKPVGNQSQLAQTEILTCKVGEQWIGFLVQQVREVVTQQKRTVMPLSPNAVVGLINLRGKVITELDVRTVVGLPPREDGASFHMAIVETLSNEDFGLIVDDVGEVTELDVNDFEPTPHSLDSVWRQVSDGVLKQKDRVLVVVNVDRFIALTIPNAAITEDETTTVH